jgi:hypothetical protein
MKEMEYWSDGVLELWSTGVMGYWSDGALENKFPYILKFL